MKKCLTYINSLGQSLELESYPYLLQDFEPNFAPATILSDLSFNQDGRTFLGALLNERNIYLEVIIKGDTESDLIDKCNQFYRAFNPKAVLGTLIYDNGHKKYQIHAAISDGPKEMELISNVTRKKYSVGLYCPSPAWESFENHVYKMVGFMGGMELPTQLPCILATQGDTLEINYKGSLDAPIIIEFRGPAILPKILKEETGELVEVLVELLEDEKLIIDTNPSAVDVYKLDSSGDKISAFNYVNPLSEYFQLTYGINTLSFEAASGSPEVYIHYRERYIGAV